MSEYEIGKDITEIKLEIQQLKAVLSEMVATVQQNIREKKLSELKEDKE